MTMAPASTHHMPRVRDPRLDFYRGIAMLIIFTSHTPGNFWHGVGHRFWWQL